LCHPFAYGGPPAAHAVLSAERRRAALSSPASAATLSQRALPEGGAEMVAMESPREISADGGGPPETERSKPPLPGMSQEPEISKARSS